MATGLYAVEKYHEVKAIGPSLISSFPKQTSVPILGTKFKIFFFTRFLFRLKIWRKYNKLMMDSGVIKDPDIRGGKLGVMCFSQEKIIWSAISTRCLGKRNRKLLC